MHSWADLIALGELGDIVSGATPKTGVKEYWGGDIPWITPADLTSHEGIYFAGHLRRITKKGFANCSARMLPAGSILFSSRAPIGHCAVTTYAMCTNQGFKSIIPNKHLDSVYGYFALRHVTPDIIAQGRGATFLEVTKDIVENVRIPLPPPPEQRRIAAILACADRLRRLRRTALQLSESYLQSVFVQMFGDPATNPMGWDYGIIDDVVAESQYGTSSKSNNQKRGYPILGMGNISYAGDVELDSLAYVELSQKEFTSLKLEHGDIIFNRTNSTELVGKTAHWHYDLDAVLASYLIKLKLNDLVLPDYFVALLNLRHYKRLFQERCKKAVGQSNISPTLLKEFSIMMPDKELQQHYSLVFRRYERLRVQQHEALRQAEHLFQTLLHRAFRGELGQGEGAVEAEDALAQAGLGVA